MPAQVLMNFVCGITRSSLLLHCPRKNHYQIRGLRREWDSSRRRTLSSHRSLHREFALSEGLSADTVPAKLSSLRASRNPFGGHALRGPPSSRRRDFYKTKKTGRPPPWPPPLPPWPTQHRHRRRPYHHPPSSTTAAAPATSTNTTTTHCTTTPDYRRTCVVISMKLPSNCLPL
jgi:hypothetical protein